MDTDKWIDWNSVQLDDGDFVRVEDARQQLAALEALTATLAREVVASRQELHLIALAVDRVFGDDGLPIVGDLMDAAKASTEDTIRSTKATDALCDVAELAKEEE